MRWNVPRCACGLAFTLVAAAAAPLPPTPREPAPAESTARAEVEALLAEQVEAWNQGDLVKFTSVYAADATFVSPTGLNHGREEVLARYRRRYPDRRAMGRLTLEVVEARPLGFAAAGAVTGASAASSDLPTLSSLSSLSSLSMVARWRLAYPEDPDHKPAQGLTLLVLERKAGRWEILQDASM